LNNVQISETSEIWKKPVDPSGHDFNLKKLLAFNMVEIQGLTVR